MGGEKKKKKSGSGNWKRNKKAILTGALALFVVLLAGAGIIGYRYYRLVYNVNVDLHGSVTKYLYIPSNADFTKVKTILYKEKYIIDSNSFEWLAEKKGYTQTVKAGRYLLRNGMTNNALINLLRSGKQEPIKLTFNNVRTKDQFIAKLNTQLEADPEGVRKLLNDADFLKKYGLDTENVMCIFLPNTYEFYWNTTDTAFFSRMYREYSKFWNKSRVEKAAADGLTKEQAVILASIVYSETKKKDEMSRVAGVYMNRIERGIPLQADPTVIFAIGDFTIKRVLTAQTKFESPYNTYLHTGLPPGPICLPEPYVIDKVLDFEKHDYIFFCAKEDFSGYHNFAKTSAQHEQNARKYRDALDRAKIKR
ncbi:MAG: endolytic transglycosylase MltG [Bacteroidota bacterium]